MAQFRRRRAGAIAAALTLAATLVAALYVAPVVAQGLYDQPVLAFDPGMHTGEIKSLAADLEGRFAVTGGADGTVRIWRCSDGKLLRAISIPVGPAPVGSVYAVAISPDGSTIAAGGYTAEPSLGGTWIYLFNREVRRPG